MALLENEYTLDDWLNASSYAARRILMNKCENPQMKKIMPGIGWVPDKRLQNANCPPGLHQCQESFGSCKFLTKDSCLSQSGNYQDMGQGDKPYLEWSKDNQCILGNFALRNWCENPHSRRAGQFVPGVTNTPPFKYDSDTGRCLMTKPYCKYMGVDFTDVNDDFFKETGIAVPDCHESDVQKFVEKYITGKTLFRGFKRGLFTKFLEDVGKTLFMGPLSYYTFVKKTVDGQFSEDLGLNVDYSGIQEDFINTMKEQFKNNATQQTHNEKYNVVTGVCDPSVMLVKKVMGPNFGGEGIHLYFIEWKQSYLKDNLVRNVAFGFVSDELEKKYGHLIKNKGGKKVIEINTNDIKDDKNLKRMYMIYGKQDWFYTLLSNFLINGKIMSQALSMHKDKMKTDK